MTDTQENLDSGDFGGRYEAKENDDGTWTIYDVPIMGPLPPGARQNTFPIDRAWLLKAIEAHRRFMSEGYVAPLHVNHHDHGRDTQSAGMFVPKRVATIKMGGKKVPVILADLLRVPAEVFSQIQKLRLPYRSPEVAKWEDPQIASLALLPDEAPYFKLPLLSVDVGQAETRVGRLKKKAQPAVAMCATEGGGSILFRLQTNEEITMDKFGMGSDPTLADDEDIIEEDEDIEEDAGVLRHNAMMAVLSKIASKLGVDEEDKDDDDDIELDEKKGYDKPEMLDEEDADIESEEEDVEINIEDKAPVDQDDEEKMEYSEPIIAKLKGKVAALEQSNRSRLRAEKIETMAQKAINELRDWDLDSETVKTVHVMAEAGSKPLKTFVESFKRSTPQDPPTTFDEFERFNAGGGVDCRDEVMKFQERGPEAFEAAQRAARDWELLNDRGRTDVPLDRFIEIQLNHGE